jgi:hypothetical protein
MNKLFSNFSRPLASKFGRIKIVPCGGYPHRKNECASRKGAKKMEV